MRVSDEWIKDAERFTIKNYTALTTLKMLWHFGLSSRPNNMDSAIQTVAKLKLNRLFLAFVEAASFTTIAKTLRKEPLLFQLSKRQKRDGITPLCLIPFSPPMSKFSLSLVLLLFMWSSCYLF